MNTQALLTELTAQEEEKVTGGFVLALAIGASIMAVSTAGGAAWGRSRRWW
jgi:hypothetical protein